MRKIKILPLFFAFVCLRSSAQDRPISFSIAGGAVGNAFFRNTKFPGYTAKLWAETNMKEYEDRKYWYAVEYSFLPAVESYRKQYDPTGPGFATYYYSPSSLLTFTIGGRKYFNNPFVLGLGVGIGVHTQGFDHMIPDDPTLEPEQPQKKLLIGMATAAHFGYRLGSVELLATYHGNFTIIRTINLRDPDDVATNSYVAVFGLTLGYTF